MKIKIFEKRKTRPGDFPQNLAWIHSSVPEVTDGRRTPAPRQYRSAEKVMRS